MKYIIPLLTLLVVLVTVAWAEEATAPQTEDLETAQQFYGGYGRGFGYNRGFYGGGYRPYYGGGFAGIGGIGFGGFYGGGYGGYGGYGYPRYGNYYRPYGYGHHYG